MEPELQDDHKQGDDQWLDSARPQRLISCVSDESGAPGGGGVLGSQMFSFS